MPQGAATSVLLAASPLLDGIGGRYFEDCNESRVVAERPTDFSGGVAPYALDRRTPRGCGEYRRSCSVAVRAAPKTAPVVRSRAVSGVTQNVARGDLRGVSPKIESAVRSVVE